MGCIVPDRGCQSQHVFARPGAHRVRESPGGVSPRLGWPAALPGFLAAPCWRDGSPPGPTFPFTAPGFGHIVEVMVAFSPPEREP